MDVGRLDDIFKNMAVQVKHGRPQNPVHQNMGVHGLKTSKTWTSKIWKHGRPCYLKRKYGRSNVVWSDRMLNNSFVLPESKTMMSPRCLSLRHQLLETRSRSFPSNFQNGFSRFARFARFTWFWRLTASVSTLQRLQNQEGQEILTPPLHRNVRYIVVQGPRVGWAHFSKRTGFWSE